MNVPAHNASPNLLIIECPTTDILGLTLFKGWVIISSGLDISVKPYRLNGLKVFSHKISRSRLIKDMHYSSIIPY
jgi:hypothetical protein